MGERKVVNKYIPADFDPSLVPKGKKLSAKDGTVPVRMMLPFSLQCSTCGEFLYRGRKFNSKKEAMGGPDGVYLGITRWRFYIKCTSCARPITFLTDPKNGDYEMESGGTRNYEVYKDKEAEEEKAAEEEEEEKKLDPMKALENRVLDSQREMADLDNLEEIKAMNARHVTLMKNGQVDPVAVLAAREAADAKAEHDEKEAKRELTEEDEALVQSIKFGQPSVKRLNEEDEKRLEQERKRKALMLEDQQRQLAAKVAEKKKKAMPIVKVKRKTINEESLATKKMKSEHTAAADTGSGGLSGLLGGYGSDSDSDSDSD